MSLRRFARFAPLAAVMASVATAGCFATRNDVRLLQLDVARLQHTVDSSRMAADAAARALNDFRVAQSHTDSVLTAGQREFMLALGLVSDSVHSLSDQLSRFRAITNDALYELGQQQVHLGAVLGASQKQLADMAAANEAGRDARTAAAVPDTGTPRPRKLIAAGQEQLRKGNGGTAAEAFQLLLSKYPDDSLVPNAMLGYAMALTMNGNDGIADSVYQSLVERFPKSDVAPTALYKRAEALEKGGQPKKARSLYQQLCDDYPHADEVGLAKDRIKSIPPL